MFEQENLKAVISGYAKAGKSTTEIAEALNRQNIKTIRGLIWSSANVYTYGSARGVKFAGTSGRPVSIYKNPVFTKTPEPVSQPTLNLSTESFAKFVKAIIYDQSLSPAKALKVLQAYAE